MMLRIGIIGMGYWGPVLLSKLYEISPVLTKTVIDIKTDRLKIIKKKYPNITVSNTVETLLLDKEIDAAIIATPVSSHFILAKKALLANKHVLVEKPLTDSVKEAKELISLSQRKKLTLMVDHILLYTKAVQKIKSLFDRGILGKLQYFDSIRINLGLFKNDVNVLWDLAPHDLAILHYLMKERPVSIQAIGISHTKNGIENIAFLILRYRSGFTAHFNCSWSSPIKIRTILLAGDKKMVVFNDIEPTEKIKVYDREYSIKTNEKIREARINYRSGDIFIPNIEINDAVQTMIEDFCNAIIKRVDPISNWESGLRVVEILELAQKSLKRKGQEILL